MYVNQRWWKNIVVYQIYPKSFKDTNHDGIGDLRGVIQKLDYLQELGIDAIWLNPVYRSPMDDNGYDISDYEAIANEFGTMDDMDQLIVEAKQRGIRIIMDLVINHTSDEHPWFIESSRSKDNPKRDWYIWRDPKADGSPPTNWRSIFGGSAWQYDERTEQYYLHVFSKKQPDLNWENSEVRQALYRMVNYWLDKGIGGFRIDAITYIKKNTEYPDLAANSPDGLAQIADASLNQPGIHEFLHELKANTFDNYDIFTVAEAPGVPPSELPSYVGEDGVFDMLFEFGHVELDLGKDGKWYQPTDWTLVDLKKVISESQKVVNSVGWSALYIENHDLPRSVNKFFHGKYFGPKSAKMLATFYFFLRGTPFIYQGQELGMTNVEFTSINEYDDIATMNQYHWAVQDGYSADEALEKVRGRSRDNARTPMQWDASANAGFSSHKPWLGVNPNYSLINVEKQLHDTDSVYHYYRKLISLRKSMEVIQSGKFEMLMTEDPSIVVYTRVSESEKVLVVLNFTNSYVQFVIPKQVEYGHAELLMRNYDDEVNNDVHEFMLQPFETRVYSLK